MDTRQRMADLTDPDEGTRAAALEDLQAEMDDEIARALLAIIALGPLIDECGIDYSDDVDFGLDPELGPPVSRETFASIVQEITRLYHDAVQPKLVCRRAFEVLVRDPKPWHADEIRKHFWLPDDDWRLTAVFAMGMIAGFDKEVAAMVEKADGPLLFEAVRAAGGMGVRAAAPRIRDLATSAETPLDLRLEAIAALPAVDPGCIDILDELSQSSDAEIADAAEQATFELLLGGSSGVR